MNRMTMALSVATMTLTAGAAMAEDCEKHEGRAAAGSVVVTAVGHGDHGEKKDGHAKAKGETKQEIRIVDGDREIKIVITDGDAKAWVDGEKVDAERLKLDGGRVMLFNKHGENMLPEGTSFGRWMSKGDDGPAGRFRAMRAPDAPAPPGGPRLGVVVVERDGGEVKRWKGADGGNVVIIERVLEGTPADKAGLKARDVIFKVDGERAKSTGTLREMITKRKPGEKVGLKVLRGDEEKEFVVELAPTGGDHVFFAPDPPKADGRYRVWALSDDPEVQKKINETMKMAERYAQRAQREAQVFAERLEKKFKSGEFEFDVEFDFDAEQIEKQVEEAMGRLEKELGQLDIEAELERLPKMRFLEDDNHKVIVEELDGRRGELRQRERELAERMKDESASDDDDRLDRLEERMGRIEALLEKALDRLEDRN